MRVRLGRPLLVHRIERVVGRAPAFRSLIIVLLRVRGVLEEGQALARPVLETVDGGEELAHVGELLLVEVAVVQHVPPLHHVGLAPRPERVEGARVLAGPVARLRRLGVGVRDRG